MPNISLTMPETAQSVTRPVIYDIINQIQNITRISPKSKILYPGDIQYQQTPGTSIDDSTHQNRNPNFNSDRYTSIEVEEDYDHNALGSTAITRKEHIPVFQDTPLKVSVTPIYATSQVTINFKYRCPSKTEAMRWRDDMRIRISQMRDINLHAVTYHYLLPQEVLEILQAIYLNREAYLGYGQSLPEYIVSHSSDRLTTITDSVNQYGRLAISETQMRIVGMFDYDAIPDKPERDDQTGTWTISFSYKFSYEKPIACHMRYPIIVHNKLLPSDYISFVNKDYKLEQISKSFSLSLSALNAFEADTIINAVTIPDEPIRIPYFDDFNITASPKGTGILFSALTEVDTTDKRTLLNLHELGDYMLNRHVLEFILKSERPYACKIYKSLIYIHLYIDDTLAPSGILECLENGDIRTIVDCDLRKQHRVVMSIVKDLTYLDRKPFKRIIPYPDAVRPIIGAINPPLADLITTPEPPNPPINPIELDLIYDILVEVKPNVNPIIHTDPYPRTPKCGYHNSKFRGLNHRLVEEYMKQRYTMKTVMNYGLLALRRDLPSDKQAGVRDGYHSFCEFVN